MTNTGRPRVFHFITRLLKGGAERVMFSSVLSLDQYDFTVGYGASYNQEQVSRLSANGVGTKQFPLMRHYNPATAPLAVFSVARYLQKHDFDIVHTHSTEAGIIGRLAAAIAGVPHIVHRVHGVPFTNARPQIVNLFVLGCERLAARYTDCVITNADIMAEAYLDRDIGQPEQYTTIPVGIDLDQFRNVTPATDLPGSRPRIAMVARLAEGKGFKVMLDAVERLSDDDTSVCLVGDGPLTDSLSAEITERGLDDRVFLTGYRDDIPRVLAACDIFALPSFWEGTPRVIVEAMASGLPVVATDIAGIPEQVTDGESGYLIAPGDSEALANRLETLLSDSQLREQMGERGRERVGQFSTTTMLGKINDVYQTLLMDKSESHLA